MISGTAYVTDAATNHGVNTPVESYSDFGNDSKGRATYWKMEIKACEKEMEKWRERATRVVNRYRDTRIEQGVTINVKKYNMLWSIINTTMPAVYGRPPTPIVMRRFTDPDQVARVAALILERGLDFQLCFQSDFHPAIKNALQDRLLPGMGCAWVRYQKSQESPTGTLDNDYYARLAGNVAAVDFVYWEDFGFVPSRTWEEVPAVWRTIYMTRDELVARFGDKIGNAVPLDYVPARHPNASQSTIETDEPKHTVFKQAKIYEIWDKRTSTVCWVSLQWSDLLDEKADPMRFPGFFPCPKPLFATNTTGNLVPVPDYVMYQDQADEIDTLTQRLQMLVKALKVVGVYDQGQEGIQRMFTEGVDNQLIPVDTWAAFAEKGGIKGTMDLLPLDTIIEVVDRLFNVRQQLIQDIYQITGLSDIIRGASNPNETLGAQKIKAQFASVRLDALKQDLARFVTDILRLMAHVMVEFFDDKTLVQQSAIMQSPDGQKAIKDAQAAMAKRMQMQQQPPPMAPQAPPAPGGMLPQPAPLGNVVPMNPGMPMPVAEPPPPMGIVAQALQLLRQGRLADYRIEIDSDTLVQPDLETERAARNEFITGITQFLQQALPAVEGNPQFLPIAQSLLMFGIRGFRVGRDIEGVIEAAFDDMRNNPPPPKPDPKAQALQAQAQNDQMKIQGDLAAKNQELQMEMQKMNAEIVADREKRQTELESLREKTMAEVQAILIKAGVQAQVTRDAAAQKATIASAQMQGDIVQGAQEMAQADAQHQQDMAQSAQTHQMSLQQAAETNANEADKAHEQGESSAERKAEGE
jgi:hypothetical protein